MTKKDYEAIAKCFRDTARRETLNMEADDAANEQLDSMARSIATVMGHDNPRFDRSRFLAACRGEDSQDSAGRTVRYSGKR